MKKTKKEDIIEVALVRTGIGTFTISDKDGEKRDKASQKAREHGNSLKILATYKQGQNKHKGKMLEKSKYRPRPRNIYTEIELKDPEYCDGCPLLRRSSHKNKCHFF